MEILAESCPSCIKLYISESCVQKKERVRLMCEFIGFQKKNFQTFDK